MQLLDSSTHTMLMPAGTIEAALRLATPPTMAGPAFAFGQAPVATLEMLSADGGWLVAQHDLAEQLY